MDEVEDEVIIFNTTTHHTLCFRGRPKNSKLE